MGIPTGILYFEILRDALNSSCPWNLNAYHFGLTCHGFAIPVIQRLNNSLYEIFKYITCDHNFGLDIGLSNMISQRVRKMCSWIQLVKYLHGWQFMVGFRFSVFDIWLAFQFVWCMCVILHAKHSYSSIMKVLLIQLSNWCKQMQLRECMLSYVVWNGMYI